MTVISELLLFRDEQITIFRELTKFGNSEGLILRASPKHQNINHCNVKDTERTERYPKIFEETRNRFFAHPFSILLGVLPQKNRGK